MQITVTPGHVDNPARGVKFRRHNKSAASEIASEDTGERRWRPLRSKPRPKLLRTSTWHGIVLASLKRNEISLVPYVPDRVLTTLIKNLHADPLLHDLSDRA